MCNLNIICPIILFIITGRSAASEYFPIQIGNKWEYIVHADIDYEVENEVLGKIVVNNITWYKLRDFNNIFWVRSGKSGQYEAINWFDNNNPQTSPVASLMFKYPINKTTVYVAGEDKVIAYYRAVKIRTPAGKFECIMYQMGIDKNNHSKSCIAYGIGVVWSEVVINGKPEIAELLKYEIN